MLTTPALSQSAPPGQGSIGSTLPTSCNQRHGPYVQIDTYQDNDSLPGCTLRKIIRARVCGRDWRASAWPRRAFLAGRPPATGELRAPLSVAHRSATWLTKRLARARVSGAAVGARALEEGQTEVEGTSILNSLAHASPEIARRFRCMGVEDPGKPPQGLEVSFESCGRRSTERLVRGTGCECPGAQGGGRVPALRMG